MKMNLTSLFFLSFMIMGVMLCLCSNNWLFIWCGLELSLISFLPIMHSKMIISSESCMKYFLVQSISSSILIMGVMSMVMIYNYDFLIMISIVMKMGVAPFHLWLLSVVEGLNFFPMVLMFTISKIAPLMVLTLLNLSVTLVVSMTLIVGSILGLNQSSIRKIITYSSIFNMGLILISIKNNFVWIFYLIIYSVLISLMMWILFKMNMFYLNQVMLNEFSIFNKLSLWFILLSMGGMPPFLGFAIKLMVIEFLLFSNLMILNLVMIILLSLLVMFFYLRITYLSIMFFSLKPKWETFYISYMSHTFTLFNFISLPLLLTFKSFN